MKKILVAMLCLMASLTQGANVKKPAASSNTKLATTQDSLSYALGLTTGAVYKNNLKQYPGGEKSINKKELLNGISNGIYGDSTKYLMDLQTAMIFLQRYTLEMEQKKAEQEEAAYQASKKANDQYLTEKLRDPGFIELIDAPSQEEHGTLVKTIKKGEGDVIVGSDYVRMKYTAKLTNGKVFDSTDKEGSVDPIDGVISGLADALLTLQKGAKATVIIPSELGYGREEIDNGTIPANSIIIYDIEILDVYHTEDEARKYLQSIGSDLE